MNLKNKFNYQKMESYIKGSILIRWLSHLKKPIVFFQILLLICIAYSVFDFLKTRIIELPILIGSIILFYAIFTIKMTRDEQLILLYFVWKISKFIICFIIILACSLRFFMEDINYFLYPILIAFVWLPSIEFLKLIRIMPYPFFFLRIGITVVLVQLWYQSTLN